MSDADEVFLQVYEEVLERRRSGFPVTESWIRGSYPKSWARILALLRIEERLGALSQGERRREASRGNAP